MEIFGAEWAVAWQAAINADPAYREAGRSWQGGVVLRMKPAAGTTERCVFVDLDGGECRTARVATAADVASSPWIIAAPADTWRQVLDGRIDPILGVLSGKLALERGHVFGLVPYARAAKVLLAAATRVPTEFPDGNGSGSA